MKRPWVGLLIRAAVTVLAFGWLLRWVELDALGATLSSANPLWIGVSIALFSLTQFGCILRWRLLVPAHSGIHLGLLVRSYLVASFFNTFLPTTVGGDVIRGYDLIRVTGEWKPALASVLVDRLIGLAGFLTSALVAWSLFPPAREDPLIRSALVGFCGLVLVTLAVLGSRRILRAMLKPFGKIGLGQLESHAKQFQEAIRAYLRQPGTLLRAFGITMGVQVTGILMFASVSKALALPVPLLYLVLIVPIVITISQAPVSLNGWGVREWAMVLFLQRIQVGAAEALSLSLLCAAIPLLSAAIGAGLFLAQKKRKRKPAN